jgi:outer membrane biosynthesis protein TonB
VKPRYRKYIIFASILLHVLLFIFWEAAIYLKIFEVNITPESPPETAPIVFDLQPERPREVIETPDDARTVEKQKKADFLSDKNALARNQEPITDKKIGEAFSRGVIESHDLPPTQGPTGGRQVLPERQKKDQAKQTDELSIEDSAKEIIKEYVEKQQNFVPPGVKERIPGVTHDNPETMAMESGGLSFNTYDWNFAPYMLALKKRIGRNIYPPPAFTRLGLINGTTLLRFKIYPDGQMKDLEIMGYEGHKSLMQTSNTAIEISAPFPSLPADFPESFLEVTCRFSYITHTQK